MGTFGGVETQVWPASTNSK